MIVEPFSSGAVHKRCISPLPGIATRSVIGSGDDVVWANTSLFRDRINEMLKTNTSKIILFEDNSIL